MTLSTNGLARRRVVYRPASTKQSRRGIATLPDIFAHQATNSSTSSHKCASSLLLSLSLSIFSLCYRIYTFVRPKPKQPTDPLSHVLDRRRTTASPTERLVLVVVFLRIRLWVWIAFSPVFLLKSQHSSYGLRACMP